MGVVQMMVLEAMMVGGDDDDGLARDEVSIMLLIYVCKTRK